MVDQNFKAEIIKGLQKDRKQIASKYFYDENGDKIFKRIMELDEYYLTNCELEIIQEQATIIAENLLQTSDEWNVIEFGAGDGSKTVLLLEKLLQENINVSYSPMDISENILNENNATIKSKLPNLKIKPIHGNYFKTFNKTVKKNKNNLILFLGSNIGNYDFDEAQETLFWIKQNMNVNDKIIVAFDLKKNPKMVLSAYNDGNGVTKEFNMNLLKRLNKELNANFNVNWFDHFPNYDPVTGNTFSFLVSLIKQTVTIDNIDIVFEENEVIKTEISKKYDLDEINQLFEKCEFKLLKHFTDSKKFYTLSLGTSL